MEKGQQKEDKPNFLIHSFYQISAIQMSLIWHCHCNSVTLKRGTFNKRKYCLLSQNTNISWTLLLKTEGSTDPQESKGTANSGYPIYIKVREEIPTKTKKNKQKHPLQTDCVKLIWYEWFCAAADYKPLLWPLSDTTVSSHLLYSWKFCLLQTD